MTDISKTWKAQWNERFLLLLCIMTINFQGLDLGTFWARSSLITCINKRLWWNLTTHVHVWRLQKSSISYIHTHVCTCRSTYKYIQCTYCIEQINTAQNKQRNNNYYMYLWKSGLIAGQDSLLFLEHGHHLILCCSFKPCRCSGTTLLCIRLSIRPPANRTGTGWRKWALVF